MPVVIRDGKADVVLSPTVFHSVPVVPNTLYNLGFEVRNRGTAIFAGLHAVYATEDVVSHPGVRWPAAGGDWLYSFLFHLA